LLVLQFSDTNTSKCIIFSVESDMLNRHATRQQELSG
jgi:hypothetical protein